MFELIARIGIALLAVFAASAFGRPDLTFTAEIVTVFLGYTAIAYMLEVRNQRNSGISGIIAVIDSACICALLAKAGALQGYGFTVLLPLLWATTRHDADPLNMSPLVASTVMIASNLFGGPGFSAAMLIQSAGILVIGMISQKSRVIIQEKHVVVERFIDLPASESEIEPEMRENIRALREHAREVEKRSRRDRYAVLLHEATHDQQEPTMEGLAKIVLEVSQAEGIALYTFNELTHSFGVQGIAGTMPASATVQSLDSANGLGEAQLKHRFEKELLSLREMGDTTQVATLCLKSKGKVIGVLGLFHNSLKFLESAVERAQEAVDTLSQVVVAHIDAKETSRRLREAEILYAVACTSSGADTPQTLSARIVRELGETLNLDHIGVFFVADEEAIQIVTRGNPLRLFEQIKFNQGEGLEGWILDSAPETILYDAYADRRLPEKVAIKKRVGSYAIFPIKFGATAYGFLTAGMGRVDGLDAGRIESLRLVTAELGQAIARFENPNSGPEGLMTPKEFRTHIATHPRGSLVYLDVVKKEDMTKTYGQTAIDLAVRRMATLLRQKLPTGAGLCRREEGDFVAFLRDTDEIAARQWANDATNLASSTILNTPDGRARIPLSLRSKVAPFAPHINQVSTPRAS